VISAWVALCMLPFALRTGFPPEDADRTKETTKEKTSRKYERKKVLPPAGGMAVGKTPRGSATYLALGSIGIEAPAVEMADGKRPRSRRSGERRDQDAGCRHGSRQDAS